MSNAVWLVSRKLTDLAGPWDERLSLDDDGEYFCRIIRFSKKIKFVERAKVFYRQWNPVSLSRSKSDKAYISLLLSMKLSMKYLLEIEDSERTGSACVNYIQKYYELFYPEKVHIIKELNKMANSLGGRILNPNIDWKIKPEFDSGRQTNFI